MSRRRPIGPPRGAAETAEAARQAVLGSRFRNGPEDASHTPHTGLTPASETPRTPARKRRAEPEGKVRRTYYLAEGDADALERAVTQICDALGGRVERHRVLGAVIAAGTAQADRITADLRAELRAELLGDLTAPGD